MRKNAEGGQEEEKGKQHTFLNSRKMIENSEATDIWNNSEQIYTKRVAVKIMLVPMHS